MPDDYLSTTQTTGAVAVGGSATGEIETSKDFDWFAVDLVAGHTYVIGLEGADSGGGALQDPVLRGLYDADGNRIAGARDNDGGAGRDARLTFTAATTGAYYIEARGHLNQTGEYTVRVTEWVDTDAERGGAADLGDITALAGPQFPAASLDGSSDSVDYWRFTLSEARRVGLGLRRQDANADLFLEDAEGNVLYSGTEEGTANEWISQTLLAGTYFVRVEAQEEGANEFKLRYGVSGANPDVVAALEQQQQGTDEAPEFAQPSYAFDLAENADGGAISVALGAVSATDPENSTITYSIEAGDSGGLFAIDSGTGALSYQGAGEDYESGTTSYELTVRASDGGLHSDRDVNVTDVAEAPAFAEGSYAFSLAENADARTGYLWARLRPQTEDAAVSYSIRRATPVACSPSTPRRAPCRTRERARTTSRARPAMNSRCGRVMAACTATSPWPSTSQTSRGRRRSSRWSRRASKALLRRYPSRTARTFPRIHRRLAGLPSAARRRAISGARATGMGLRWSWLRGGPTSSISGAARRATAHWTIRICAASRALTAAELRACPTTMEAKATTVS